MTSIQNGPFIVTGASGQLGRQVVDLLVQAGAGPVIAISRTPEKLADLAGEGVEARRGDFNDPASLEAAFAGGKRLLIISTDDLEPGKRLAAHSNAIAAASAAPIIRRRAGATKRTKVTNEDTGFPGSPNTREPFSCRPK